MIRLVLKIQLLAVILLALSSMTMANSIDELEDILQKPVAMSGQFQQEKKIAILKRPLESTGIFSVAAGQGVIWTVENPSYSQLIITEEKVQFSEKLSENVGRSMRYVGDILSAILVGDFAALEQQFTILEITVDANKQWALHLEPKSLLMRKALAAINIQGGSFPRSIKLLEATGDYTLITLSAIEAFDAVPVDVQSLLQTE